VPFRNTAAGYGLLSKSLHWLNALLIPGLIALGCYMVGLTYYDRWYNAALSWHKSLGLIALGLALVMTGWQWYSPPPAPPAGLQSWERLAARVMRAVLLVMMIVIPISGYLISTSAGQGVDIFGVLHVPALLHGNAALRDGAIAMHFYSAYGIVFLVLGHAGAALKHHFINRDDTLRRML
jgi:cytochrome b561